MASPLSANAMSIRDRQGAIGVMVGLMIDLVLITVLAFVISQIAWVVLSPASLVSASVDLAVRAAPSSSTFRADPAVFARFDPFSRSVNAAPSTVQEDAPETTLNLKIRSLISSTVQEQSVVRIELPNGESRRFSVGDSIVSGVTLDRILSDRVVLLRNGEREVLLAKEAKVLSSVSADGSPTVDPTPQAQIIAPAPRASEFRVKAQQLSQLMQVADIRRLADPAGSGRTVLQLVSTSDPAVISAFGLQAQDYLLSLNGIDLRESNLVDTLPQIQNARELTLDIIRNNAPKTITVKVEE